jgi:hypothetical protein
LTVCEGKEKGAVRQRAAKALVARRVSEILRIRLGGAGLWDLREYVTVQGQIPGSAWELPPDCKPLSDSQLYRYIQRADREITKRTLSARRKRIRLHISKGQRLYAKAIQAGDLRTALACLEWEAKLLGLDEVGPADRIRALEKEVKRCKAAIEGGDARGSVP